MSTRTPLFAFLKQAYRLAKHAHQTALPTDELTEAWLDNRQTLSKQPDAQSRRAFLRNSSRLALTISGAGLLQNCAPDVLEPAAPATASGRLGRDQPRFVIIGAGIAGLNAAHTLTQRGFTNFAIYEAANRTGGRIFTARDLLTPGFTTELGGEFIDSGHRDMLRLAREFNLTLLDTQAPSEQALIKDAYYFKGRLFSLQEVVSAFRRIAPTLEADIKSLPNTISYTTKDPAVQRFDRLSIAAYLAGIDMPNWLHELLSVAYVTEYGLEAEEQSAINLLFLISADTKKGAFDIFGLSDERYKIRGGNQQITDRLAQLYASQIETGRALSAIRKKGSRYELSFDEMSQPVLADRVLLTLPFTKLRQVDIDFGIPAVKRQSINQLGYGTNAKLFLGMRSRVWRERGYSGYVFADNGLQSGWDSTQLQPGTAGNFTVYLGGTPGLQVGNGTPQTQAENYLSKLNELFPGATDSYTNKAERFFWPGYAYSLGSYAAYRVGQWTSIGGAEIEPVDGLFFAGEHCSADFQGYMNGGAETGRIAAGLMLKQLA